jgi:hypothetical protein
VFSCISADGISAPREISVPALGVLDKNVEVPVNRERSDVGLLEQYADYSCDDQWDRREPPCVKEADAGGNKWQDRNEQPDRTRPTVSQRIL